MAGGHDPGAGGDGEPGARPLGPHVRPGSFRFVLPAIAPNLRVARWLLREWLTSASWPADHLDGVILAVNEALSNAIEHAHACVATPPAPPPTVAVHGVITQDRDRPAAAGPRPATWRQARIEITDHGRWRPAGVHHPPPSDRGRGIPLMRALMDEVLIDTAADGGTRVTLISSAPVDGAPVDGTA